MSSLAGKYCQLFVSTVCGVIKESRILNLAKQNHHIREKNGKALSVLFGGGYTH